MVFVEILLCGFTLFLLWIYWFQNYSHTAKLLNKFPGPKTPPIIGHPLVFSPGLNNLFIGVRRLMDSYNETFRAWVVHYATVHIVRAEDAEVILSNMKHNHKGVFYDFLKPWIGEGLLISNGDKWQHRRKILTPTFHFNILRKFVSIFGDHCADFSKKLESETLNDNTDIVPLVNDMTLANICETAMGTKLDPNDVVQNQYLSSLYSVGKFIIERFFNPLLYNDFLYFLSPFAWEFNSCIRTLHKFTKTVISERKLQFKDEDMLDWDKEEKDEMNSKKRLAMLDLLIYDQKKQGNIDDLGIQEEVDTFMFEGHDTTSVATKFMLMTLANRPDIQDNVISEMDTIFGDSNRRPTYDDLQNMKYSEMVIKESLRLFPSVFFITRIAQEDIKLSKHTIPCGAEIFIHIYSIHRDPRYFPDPEKFDPNRFLPENVKGRHPYAYIPFSAGPRNCIGQKFAMLEMKSILASVFRQFRLKPIDNSSSIEWILDFVLRSKGPIRMKIEKRRN